MKELRDVQLYPYRDPSHHGRICWRRREALPEGDLPAQVRERTRIYFEVPSLDS